VTASEAQGRKWLTLAAMCFGLFLIMLDNTIVNVALPSIQRQLGASPSMLEWTINAYVLAFAVLIMLGGKLGDRFGRKKMFLVGLTIFTAMSAACALAPTAEWLVAFRTGQGVGGALMNPLTLSIIVAAFPRKELGTAIGIWAGISAVALAIGPVLGGVLVERVDWSAVFWINVPVGIVGALVTLWAVAESRDPTSFTLDLPGMGLITAGLFLVVWGLIETNSHAWASAYTIGFLVAGIATLLAFVWWEGRTPNPMVPLEFFRRPAFSAPVVLVVFVGLALFGVVYFITLYFQNVKGWSPEKAGVAALPLTGMIMLIAPFAGRLQTRFSPRQLMTTGMLMLSGGLVGLSQITVSSSYNAIWPFYVIMGAGLALTMPTTSATAMAAVDPQKAGVASGVINSARQVGAAVGLAVLGAVGATLATNSWADSVSGLPAGLQDRANGLNDLVIGGQGRVIGQIAGPAAQQSAFEAFVTGVNGAMWVGAALTFAAAMTAFFGLRGVPSPRNEEPFPSPAPSEGAPIDRARAGTPG
jgi:EmrB/QacA subfamily drug resistance transporter